MTLRLALLLSALASPALACDTYTLDNRPPGEVLATIEDDRLLTIDDTADGKTVYDLTSAGTGIPHMVGQPQGGGDTVDVLEHKGDLIIDMMIYTAFCGETVE